MKRTRWLKALLGSAKMLNYPSSSSNALESGFDGKLVVPFINLAFLLVNETSDSLRTEFYS